MDDQEPVANTYAAKARTHEALDHISQYRASAASTQRTRSATASAGQTTICRIDTSERPCEQQSASRTIAARQRGSAQNCQLDALTSTTLALHACIQCARRLQECPQQNVQPRKARTAARRTLRHCLSSRFCDIVMVERTGREPEHDCDSRLQRGRKPHTKLESHSNHGA